MEANTITADQPGGDAEACAIVHLVDDDPLLRDMAAGTLEPVGYAVTHHADGAAFLEALGSLSPGCILLDIHMPELDGFAVLQALAERRVGWPVVVLTARNDVRTAVTAMKQGACEFVQKPFEVAELRAVVADALAQLQARQASEAETARARALVEALAPRERQVLQGLLTGLPNKLIAYELDLSVRTVEIYRGKLMEKLGARGLSSAIRIALAAGVEPLPEREDH